MKFIKTLLGSFLISIAGVFILVHGYAQTSKLDSLKKELETHVVEDTARANLYILLCNAYIVEKNDKEKIEENAHHLFTLSQKLNYKKGKAHAYLFTGLIYSKKGDYEMALDNYSKALQLFEETENKRGIGQCYQNIGNIKIYQGNYTEALSFVLKAGKIKEELKDKQGTAAIYNNTALIYSAIGNYQKSLEYHFKSLRIKEEINDQLGVSISYLNIGSIFNEQTNWNESMNYYEKALKLKITLGDREGEAIVYNNMANTYNSQGNSKTALSYQLKSLKISEELGDKGKMATTYGNIGNTYVVQKKITEALGYYFKELKLAKELGDKIGIISSSNGIGTCHESNKNYSQAGNYYEEALKRSKEIDYKRGVKDAYDNLASVNEKMENYSAALSYHKLFSSVKDTLLNEESLKQTAELNMRYETDKKEKEILLLTKDQQLKDKTLKEQRLVRIGLISGLGLLLALSFLLFNRYRFKQKANLILEKQKQEIHQKNTQITDSIDYAKTIQEAILPDAEKLNAYFPDHFILYKPKAIVSGDFYWVGKKDNKIICAVADCTGHGVPGAFMSLLGHNILENVIQQKHAVDPGSILTALNEEIVTRFSKGQERETVQHGMDIALISIDHDTQQLQYAGAKNSLYLVRANTLTEIKADRQSTGIVSKDHTEVKYTNNNETLQKGDVLYMFSDGFPDQKGGADKKKFFYQPFKDLLLSIHQLPVKEQRQQLDKTIASWIGEGEQVDDILVMGIKIQSDRGACV